MNRHRWSQAADKAKWYAVAALDVLVPLVLTEHAEQTLVVKAGEGICMKDRKIQMFGRRCIWRC